MEIHGGVMMGPNFNDVMDSINRWVDALVACGDGCGVGTYLVLVCTTCCNGPTYMVPRKQRCLSGCGGEYMLKMGCVLHPHCGLCSGSKVFHTWCASNRWSWMLSAIDAVRMVCLMM